ncbi:MAG TPA: hypothetical protein VNX02_18825 [Steroidobacteraceae bacterium]|jgi:hypothetical protein|nr:hypothetical protein [Steroidobacteraceae bacterium]
MKALILGCATLLVGCTLGPPAQDSPTSSPRSEQRGEARALEQAEADCAAQGKHAVAERSEGETLYHCAD